MLTNRLKAAAKDAVELRPFLQKVVEKFQPDSAEVPARPKANPLPNGTARCWCYSKDGALWMGSDRGVLRMAQEEYARDNVQYFNAPRYLKDNVVAAITPDDANGVWVWTETGVSHIYYKEMTMAEKAAIYSARVVERQMRHGFVTTPHFAREDDFSEFTHYSEDNDGLWTAMYAASACYEYAVTGSQDALERAVTTTKAVLSLVDVTGIKGYFARSYVTKDEKLPDEGFWLTRDDGEVFWKSDTSSDEVVGHFMLYLIAHDLLPDEELKAKIRQTAADIVDYVISNDYYFIDVTGRPTMWGNWNLDYFNGRGYEDTFLNSAEMLTMVKVAGYLTGEERFAKEYKKLAYDLGYADLTCTYLARKEPTINYSDEELAYLTYLPLILLETDPELLAKYRVAMGELWRNIQRELNPLWTYIYKLIDPETDYDMEGCLWTLRRLPLDMREYSPNNVDREDYEYEPDLDRFGKQQVKTLLAPDERRIMKWNGNPFIPTNGGNPKAEEPGTVFNFPYWLGRYYGFLKGE